MDESGAPQAPRVLLVDDDPGVRFVTRRWLEQAPASVVGEAPSGEEALIQWRELRPDIVVLDQGLPGMSGLATAEQILAEDPGQYIVLITGAATDDLCDAAAQVGIRACLCKMDIHCVAQLATAWTVARIRSRP